MGLIVLPNTFTGQAAPQLPWLDAVHAVLFTLVNGGLDDANIKANALIAQSKIAGLVTDLAAAPKLDGSRNMTSGITIKADGPGIRLIGTESGTPLDFRLIESQGQVILQRNDGTEATPTWVTVFSFKADGLPTEDSDVARKAYVDIYKNLAFREVIFNASPNFTTTNPSFEDIPGMTGVLTISRARRVRIHQILSGISNTQVASISFLMMVDGVILSASRKTVGNGDNNPATDASGSYLTPVLSAGAHTFQMQWSTTNGQATLPAAGATNAGFQLEETVFES